MPLSFGIGRSIIYEEPQQLLKETTNSMQIRKHLQKAKHAATFATHALVRPCKSQQ